MVQYFPPCYKQFIRAHIRLGRRLLEQGKYRIALKYLRRAQNRTLQYYATSDSKNIESGLLLARLYSDLNFRDSAVYVLQDLELICLKNPSLQNSLVDVYNIWGRVFSSRLQFDQAIFYSKKQIYYLEQQYPDGSIPMFAAYHNLGARFMDYGEMATAETYLKSAEALALQLLDSTHPYYAIASMTLGTYFERIGNYEQARYFTETSLNIRRRIYPQTHRSVISGLINMAVLQRNNGQYGDAHAAIDEALELVDWDSDQRVHCHLIKSQIYQYQNRFSEANEWLDKAWKLFAPSDALEGISNPIMYLNLFENELINLHGVIETYNNNASIEKPIRRAEESIELFLWQFNNTQQEPDQRKLITEYRSFFDHTSSFYLSRFQWSERYTDLLSAYLYIYYIKGLQSNIFHFGNNKLLTDEQWTSLQTVQTKIAGLRVEHLQLIQDKGVGTAGEINEQILKYVKVLDSLKDTYAYERNLQTKPEISVLEQLIPRLDSHRVFLDIVILEDRLLAFSIRNGMLHGRSFPLEPEVYEMIRNWPEVDWSPSLDLHLFSPLFRILEDIVLWANPEAFPMTIIPDKQLSAFPFECLKFKEKYIAEQIPLAYDYQLNELQEREVDRIKVIGFVPQYPRPEFNEFEDVQLAALTRSEEWDLPYALEEVERIHHQINGKVFSGSDATKHNFLKSLLEPHIIHLSMHALVKSEQPWDSKLLFNSNDLEIDPLYLHELYHYTSKVPMVVLSACDTGLGLRHASEGVKNFSNVLRSTGIPAVVHTLWKISDQATADIMTGFYKNLNLGYPKDEALQKAKNTYIQNASSEKQIHPYFWAGLVQVGDYRALRFQPRINYPIYLFVFGLVLIFSFFLVRRRFY